MREIKFKLFDKVNERMYHSYGILEISMELTDWNWTSKDDIIFLQYTGLKDKNGKEIYEGDIAKFQTRKIWEDETHEERGIFFYNNEELKYDFQVVGGSNLGNLSVSRDDNEFEIIGNKFENPELITPTN